jgi:predicted kinase
VPVESMEEGIRFFAASAPLNPESGFSMPRLILVCGPPGVGKTYIGRLLGAGLECAIVDQDNLGDPLVRKILELVGCDSDDRESRAFHEHVRGPLYSSLMHHAWFQLRAGLSVVVVATFSMEANNPGWVASLKEQARVESVQLTIVSVAASNETIRQRLLSRGAVRDAGKLGDWPAFLEAMSSRYRDQLADVVIHNDPECPESLEDQLGAIVGSMLRADGNKEISQIGRGIAAS